MPNALTTASLPTQHHIAITRGDSFEIVFVVRDGDGVAISLTGLQGTAEVRSAPLPAGTLLASLTVAVDQSIADQPTTGYVTVSASGADMDASIAGVWELQLDDGTPTFAFRRTVATGSFATVSQITE